MYFTAAFLKIFAEQSPALGHAFGSVEHRHFVSHFLWGDRVRGRGEEDRVLTARRRVIQYYRGDPSPARGRFKSVVIQLPVDGTPRKITSDMGDPRDGGRRRHRGVDFDGPRGEPVRAVADGTVEFAGVDLKRGTSKLLTPRQSKGFDKKLMGNGGFMVTLRHADGLTSAYMHLDDFAVVRGQKVARGALLGHVGRTGISESPAHLHFEFRADGRHIDPMPLFGDMVFKPTETYRGRRLDYEEHRKKRRR
jgi:murein DD-endopeptidase MepM/ murein hydrolase activator NlpD